MSTKRPGTNLKNENAKRARIQGELENAKAEFERLNEIAAAQGPGFLVGANERDAANEAARKVYELEQELQGDEVVEEVGGNPYETQEPIGGDFPMLPASTPRKSNPGSVRPGTRARVQEEAEPTEAEPTEAEPTEDDPTEDEEDFDFTDTEEEIFSLMVKSIKLRTVYANNSESASILSEIVSITDDLNTLIIDNEADGFVEHFMDTAIAVSKITNEDGDIPDVLNGDQIQRLIYTNGPLRSAGIEGEDDTQGEDDGMNDNNAMSQAGSGNGGFLEKSFNDMTGSREERCLDFKKKLSNSYFSGDALEDADYPDMGQVLNIYLYLNPDEINDRYQEQNKRKGMTLMSESIMSRSANDPDELDIKLSVNPFFGHRRLHKLPSEYENILRIVGDTGADKLNIFTALGKSFNNIRIIPGFYDDAYEEALTGIGDILRTLSEDLDQKVAAASFAKEKQEALATPARVTTRTRAVQEVEEAPEVEEAQEEEEVSDQEAAVAGMQAGIIEFIEKAKEKGQSQEQIALTLSKSKEEVIEKTQSALVDDPELRNNAATPNPGTKTLRKRPMVPGPTPQAPVELRRRVAITDGYDEVATDADKIADGMPVRTRGRRAVVRGMFQQLQPVPESAAAPSQINAKSLAKSISKAMTFITQAQSASFQQTKQTTLQTLKSQSGAFPAASGSMMTTGGGIIS